MWNVFVNCTCCTLKCFASVKSLETEVVDCGVGVGYITISFNWKT